MKNAILFFMLLMTSLSLPAQDKLQDRDRDQTQDQLKLRDYLLFQDGTFLYIRDQDRDQLRDRVKLNDGSLVTADGIYANSRGERIRLNDGECLDMDGNRYVSQEQFRQRLELREQASNQLHYEFRDGSMYRIQNQIRSRVEKPAKLGGNGVLRPDGRLKLKQQDRIRLRDGECVDPEGNQYPSQTQFRHHAALRLQAMAQEHYLYSDGNMYRVQNQQRTRIEAPQRLNSGLEINPDGTFQLANQEQMRLRNGECIDPEGNIYASQNQFREHTQLQLMAGNQEHFIFQDGQMHQVVNQQPYRLRDRLTMQNGLVINPDGSFQDQAQTQNRLRDGECLDPQGNRYASQEQYQAQTRNRFMAMAEPHFYYQNGRVIQYQNQIQSQLNYSKRLQNGTIIYPDGTFQVKKQEKQQLRNGEYVDWQGGRYENQERFRERMEQRVHERQEVRDRERLERRDIIQTRKRAGMN